MPLCVSKQLVSSNASGTAAQLTLQTDARAANSPDDHPRQHLFPVPLSASIRMSTSLAVCLPPARHGRNKAADCPARDGPGKPALSKNVRANDGRGNDCPLIRPRPP